MQSQWRADWWTVHLWNSLCHFLSPFYVKHLARWDNLSCPTFSLLEYWFLFISRVRGSLVSWKIWTKMLVISKAKILDTQALTAFRKMCVLSLLLGMISYFFSSGFFCWPLFIVLISLIKNLGLFFCTDSDGYHKYCPSNEQLDH